MILHYIMQVADRIIISDSKSYKGRKSVNLCHSISYPSLPHPFLPRLKGQSYGQTHNEDESLTVRGTGPPRGQMTLEGAESQAWNALRKRVQELLDSGP